MAQAVEGAGGLSYAAEAGEARRISRRTVDLLVSWSAAIVAFVLIAVGGAAIFGGSFAKDQVSDRLGVQSIAFPPLEAMSPEEQETLGEFAGQTVDTGPEAEAYATYIGGHLAEVNEGKTYSETSSEFRAVDPEADPELAAELGAKRETLFMGEMLRGTLLNAYGWWTVGQIAFIAGIVAAVAGVVLAILVGLGFRHARKAS